jgi:hypothetical protein
MTANKSCRPLSPSTVKANTHDVMAKPAPHTMSTIDAFLMMTLSNHVDTMMMAIVIAAMSIELPIFSPC